MLDSLQRIVLLWKNKKRHHKSSIHKALDKWDNEHDLSPSQIKEFQKHHKLHLKRDYPANKTQTTCTWLEQDEIQ